MTIFNSYLSDYSIKNTNLYSLFIHSYSDAISNLSGFKNRIHPLTQPGARALATRCKQILTGLALLVPLINALVQLLLKKFGNTIIPNPTTNPTHTGQVLQPVSQQPAEIHAHCAALAAPALLPNQPQVPVEQQLPLQPAPIEHIVDIPPAIAPLEIVPEPIVAQITPQQMLQNYIRTIRSENPLPRPEMIAGLGECRCISSKIRKREVEDKVLAQAESMPKDETLHYVSVGSSEMLQDWIVLAKLVDSGFKKFCVHFIDLEYAPGKAQEIQSRVLRKQVEDSLRTLGATDISVKTHVSIDDYLTAKAEPIDILLAVDTPGDLPNKDLRHLEPNLLMRYEDQYNAEHISKAFALYLTGGGHYPSTVITGHDLATRVTRKDLYEISRLNFERVARYNQAAQEQQRLPFLAFIRGLFNRTFHPSGLIPIMRGFTPAQA